MKEASSKIQQFLDEVQRKNQHEPEFLQAIKEVAEAVIPYVEKHKRYKDARILERMVEPERLIMFRVPWLNDKGEIQINRGYRIEMSSAIGPYKGGLRFHPTVNTSILKFLAFEQIFKNSLTSLPLGAGKGGADFNPKGKSRNEIMKFCQSFMTELYRHIGPNTDIPAGDIGVGGREIGYLFGQYKRLKNEFSGVLTGKGLAYGGSKIRPEATGYGCVYFAEEMLKNKNESLKAKIVGISGSGNVAQYACEKSIELGAKVVSMSDSTGYIYDKKGLNKDKLHFLMELKNERGGLLEEYAIKYHCEYIKNQRPWDLKLDIALPCATQNELNGAEADTLIKNGCILVAEGANMPCTQEAVKEFQKAKILFGPGKAANAGGVAVSGLEMTQNSIRYAWSAKKIDKKLRDIMIRIHDSCVSYGQEKDGYINYVKGANIAGFIRVADAMLAQGIV